MKNFYVILAGALLLTACGGGKEDTPETDIFAAPEGLSVHTAKTTSLTFQWKPVSDAASYAWQLFKDGSKLENGTVAQRNVTIDELTPDTAYRFGVAVVRADGQTSEVAWVDARTAEETTDPGTTDPGTTDPGTNPGTTPTVAYEDFLIPSVEEDGIARAFPAAEGGGMYATGGRGGSVYHVTNLNNTGEGSLRYGIESAGRPLTIVFDVAGVIELGSMINIKKGDLTIAGQTAPGDGICLKNYTFRISASNVIVRFIRCRMGDEKKTEDDAIQILNRDTPYENIVIDHCSVSWCTDECASFYGMKNFTFSWNFVTESLRNSVHGKGSHGYGGIWGGENASYHHNLLAHHDSRNPRLDHDYVSTQKGPLHVFNNVVYNWSGNTCYGGESSSKNGSDYRKYNFVNNYYKPGPATPSNHIWFLEPTTSCSNCGGTILPGHFYMDGNVMYGKNDYTANNWSTSSVHASQSVIDKIKESTPYHTDEYQSLHTAEAAFTAVLAYAGASHVRDAIDTRIAKEAKDGNYTYTGSNGSKNGLIDSQTDVGGWPAYEATKDELEAAKDTDGDGIPNAVEDAWGLDKYAASDGALKTLDKNGRYTNLEMYLHYLVKDIVSGGNEGATYGKM